MENTSSLVLGWEHKFHNVEFPTMELLANGEHIMQWVQTLLTSGEKTTPYCYETISAHLANVSKATSFLLISAELPSETIAILKGNKEQLDRWSSYYNNKSGQVKFLVASLMVGPSSIGQLVDVVVEPTAEGAREGGLTLQESLELHAELACHLPPGMDIPSLGRSCSESIKVDGTLAFPPIMKPQPYQQEMEEGDEDVAVSKLFGTAVDECHMQILEEMSSSILTVERVQLLAQDAHLVLMYGSIPPNRWGAISSCMTSTTTTPVNVIQLAEDGLHVTITLRDGKRTVAQALANRKVITIDIPTNTLGGKVLQIWETVGRPFMVHHFGLDGDNLPFLLGPEGKPIGDETMMRLVMIPHVLKVCKERGWSQQLLELGNEVFPKRQYDCRKLYGSIILKNSSDAELVARVAMMDTSLRRLGVNYRVYPIMSAGMELLREWVATLDE